MKIVVTSPSFSKNSTLSSEILSTFSNTTLNISGMRFNKEELIKYLQDADAAIVGLEVVDDDVLSACPNLKIIAKYGVGLDNIDIEACQKRGIAIGWRGGVNKLSVAEMVVGFMLMLCRNLYTTANQLKGGVWNKSGGFELSGKTVGIIGFGNIGQEVARLLAPFKCKIMANDIVDKINEADFLNVALVDKDAIFRESDIITIHTPLTDKTRNLINKDSLSLMQKTAFVINTARGGIVDEDALKYALQNGDIAGAAFDVYANEPPYDSELLSLPNFICTPHIGGNSKEAIFAMGRSAIKCLKDFLELTKGYDKCML